MRVGRQVGTHFESLQCVTIDHNTASRVRARYTTKVKRVDRTNATAGHWVYANIEASRAVMLRALGACPPTESVEAFLLLLCLRFDFLRGELCAAPEEIEGYGYAYRTTHAHWSAAQAHAINIIVFSFIALSDVNVYCR